MPLATPPRHVRCRRPSPSRAARAGTPRAPIAGSTRPALRERGEHEPVPRRDRLVVARGFGRCSRSVEQPSARRLVELAAEDEAAVLERLQQLLRRAFARRPGERQPLDAVRVGVLRRREAAAVERELAQHVVERRVGDRAVALLVEAARGVQVDGGEQRVVVEHLLEVRHEPALVDRVAVEAAADEVVHAAERHPVERAARHLLLAATEQELEHRARAGTSAPAPTRPTAGRSSRASVALRVRRAARR